MAAPLRHAPRDQEGFVESARLLAQQLVEKYHHANRFTRIRAAIVGAWTLLTILTLWVACPPSGPTNPLGADVQVLTDSLIGGQQLLVRNDSSSIWTDVKLTIEGGWSHERKTVRPHDQVVLSISQFMRNGEPAPRDLKPHSLEIKCEQGHFTFDLK